MDSSISPRGRAIDSKPSATCKNGNTHITELHNYQHSIIANNSLCDSSPTDINGNATTDTGAITPLILQHGISSRTPSSLQLQGPPTIDRQDTIMDARHCNNNNKQSELQHEHFQQVSPLLNTASSTSLFQSSAQPLTRKRPREPTSSLWHTLQHMSRVVSLKSGSPSIFIQPYIPGSFTLVKTTVDGAGSMKFAHLSVVMERSHVHVEIYYAIMITRQVAFEA